MKTAVPPFVAWVAVRRHACLVSGILPVRRRVARQRDRRGVQWLELQCPSEDACRIYDRTVVSPAAKSLRIQECFA